MSAPPQPAMMLPKEIIHGTVELPHKKGARLHYSLARDSSQNDSNPGKDSELVIVFLNGLMTDKSSWLPVMAETIRRSQSASKPWPTMVAYDRYGQGQSTDRDPQDTGKEPGYGHDVQDVATDLHELLQVVIGHPARLLLVGNSIGVAIARLFTAQHPASVAGLLFLDSMMANSDFKLWPDPDAPGFTQDQLPDGVTVDVLREQRAKFIAIFKPEGKNKEGLDRRSLPKLLPLSDGPMLGQPGNRPWLTVVGHDFQAFADESLKTFGTPVGLTMQYSNPIWDKYNHGLAKLTDGKLCKGPFQAPGCGHFVQRDNPSFVVDETLELVAKIQQSYTV